MMRDFNIAAFCVISRKDVHGSIAVPSLDAMHVRINTKLYDAALNILCNIKHNLALCPSTLQKLESLFHALLIKRYDISQRTSTSSIQ